VRLFVLCLLVLLAACAEPDNGAIRLGLSAAPITLDPRYATDATSYRISRLLYASLVDFDDDYRFVPSLATWQQRSPTEWVFTLGDHGRTFHDGERLTAADVKATYESVLDRSNGSPHRGSLAMIAAVRAEGEDHVVFELSRPDALFPGRLVIGILPKCLIEQQHPFAQQPVGSGPYRLLSWPAPGRLVLQRDDGQIAEVIRVADFTVRALKLVRGELDIIQGDLPEEIVAWLDEQPGVSVQKKPGNTFAYLGFNLDDPISGDLAVRRGIAHALDREAIIATVLKGNARPAIGILPPDHWAGSQAEPLSHDLEAAQRLLAEKGYGPERPLHITLKTSTNSQRTRIAAILQQQLKQAYIDVDVLTHEWGTFYGDIKSGRFQMYSLAWVGLKLPDIFRYAFHSDSLPPDGANRGRLIDKRVDALIDAAEAAGSMHQQAIVFRQLQDYLQEILPYVPLWYEDHVAVIRDAISDYELLGDGTYDGLIAARKEARP
jgi:peptide/nickel transport system substrate-binding protein